MKNIFSLGLLILAVTGQAHDFPRNRVISSENEILKVSEHDLKLGCSPHINGETVSLLSRPLENYLKNKLLVRYENMEHPNQPSPMHFRDNGELSCAKANDRLRKILLASRGSIAVNVKITRLESFDHGFGAATFRSYTEGFVIEVGDMTFVNQTGISLETSAPPQP